MPVQVRTVPDNGVATRVGKMQMGAELKTALALCKVRLFKDSYGLPNEGATVADLELHEADFSGYPAGGIEVTAAGDPYLNESDTVLVTLPLVQFNHVEGAPNVTNDIKGAWVEDAAGVLRGVVVFDEVQTMESNSNSIPLVISFRIGALPEEL